MSANSFDRMQEFADQHGEEGLRILFLFKLLKQKAKAQIKKENIMKETRINENDLNRLCLQKAKELSLLNKEEVTEDDIKKILEGAKNKYP